jgi:hypothetical protein
MKNSDQSLGNRSCNLQRVHLADGNRVASKPQQCAAGAKLCYLARSFVLDMILTAKATSSVRQVGRHYQYAPLDSLRNSIQSLCRSLEVPSSETLMRYANILRRGKYCGCIKHLFMQRRWIVHFAAFIWSSLQHCGIMQAICVVDATGTPLLHCTQGNQMLEVHTQGADLELNPWPCHAHLSLACTGEGAVGTSKEGTTWWEVTGDEDIGCGGWGCMYFKEIHEYLYDVGHVVRVPWGGGVVTGPAPSLASMLRRVAHCG